jgi:hypothetical protein
LKAIYSLALTVLLAGCAASGTQVSERTALQFKENVTTEREIVAALGPPTGTTISGGMRYLTYTGMQYQVKGATFIPIIGGLVGGVDYQMSHAMFEIGPDGVMRKMTYSTSGSGTRSGTQPADMPAREPAAK